jgi:ssDNA-binding replication factor A large subunit
MVGYNDNLRLRSISIRKGDDRTIYDHGKLVDQDGQAARMIKSMTADETGRIYMTGSWYIKSDREATFQVLFADFPGERIYKFAKRGEFFAVAETAIDD